MDTGDNTPILERTRFAERMEQLKEARGQSYRQLAAAALLDAGYLNKIAKGFSPTPHAKHVEAIDKALQADGELIRLAQLEAPRRSRRFEPLGDEHAAIARATTTHLVALDTLHGSDGLVPMAVRAFRTAADKLAIVGGTADVRAAVADLGAAAAWITSDAVERDQSRAIALEALALADMAGDKRMHRFLLSHLSMVSEHAGRYGDALAYAERLKQDDIDSPRVQAMIHIRQARALSGLGAHDQAIDAWDRAEHMLTQSPSSDDGLTYWVHAAEMAIHKAVILSRAQSKEAVDWAHRGVELLPGEQGRDQVLFRAILLYDAVAAHAWREIPTIVEDLLQYADVGRSARVPEELTRAWRLISATRTPRPARDAVRSAYDAFASDVDRQAR